MNNTAAAKRTKLTDGQMAEATLAIAGLVFLVGYALIVVFIR